MTSGQISHATGGAEEFSALVSDIYDTVLGATRWPDVLDGVARYVGGPAAALFAKDAVARSGNHIYISGGIADDYVRLYFETYVRLDPATSAQFFSEVGGAIATEDLIHYDEFMETRFYREWAEPQGFIDFIASVIEKAPTSVTMVGVFRHNRNGRADPAARHRLQLVSPHIRRAVLIGGALEQKTVAAAELAEGLDMIRAGMLLVDGGGRIVHGNAAGYRLIETGAVVRAVNGRLSAVEPSADLALQTLFAAAAAGDAGIGGNGIALPLSGGGGERYVASLLPLTSGARRQVGTSLAAVAMLFVHPATLQALQAPEIIARAFKLTPSELRVLLAVVEVGGGPAVAETLGIAETTVKFHLRRLFEKTGTHRQADLVRLVAGYANSVIG